MLILASLVALSTLTPPSFPQDFVGNWKGEMEWIQVGGKGPQKVPMELKIQPKEEADVYSWTIIYGDPKTGTRDYLLRAVDKAKGIWTVDEGGGVRLDQYWIGGELRSSFTVGENTIVGRVARVGETLLWELTTFGPTKGDAVKVAPLQSLQRAILKRK